MRFIKPLLTGILLTLFVGGMSISLFHVAPVMGGEIGMDMLMSGEMPASMSGCAFVSHVETVCSMSLLDHIGAWKDTFTAVVPGLFVLMMAASLLFVTINSLAPNLLKLSLYLITNHKKHILERTDTFIYKFLQELFSKGILNTKLF